MRIKDLITEYFEFDFDYSDQKLINNFKKLHTIERNAINSFLIDLCGYSMDHLIELKNED